MNLSKSLKTVKQEAKVSDVFSITHLNSPTIFESHSGLIGSVIRVQGIAFDMYAFGQIHLQKENKKLEDIDFERVCRN